MAVRVRTTALALAIGLVALLLVPGAASAKHCGTHTRNPAGNSESEQYGETVPGACGNKVPGGGAGSPGTASPATQHELQSLGPAGRATATLAQATSPGGKALQRAVRSSGGESGGSAAVPAGKGEGTSLGSLLAALSRALTGDSSGGVGILLPLVLAAVAAGGIAIALRRRRAGPAS
jgi:hypothetical protein